MTPTSPLPTRLPRTLWTIPPIAAVAVACVVLGVWLGPHAPTARQWQIAGILGAVAVAGAAIRWRMGPPDEESTPPWSVHTLWLLPAALLTPPLAYMPLLALSLVLTFVRRTHGLATRVAVSSITASTTVAVHWIAQGVDDLLLAGLAGIALTYVVGLVVALVAAFAFTGPTGTALWLDYRWSFVQLGCSFAGLLTAAAIAHNPLAGFAALAPVLMAEFTLNWPELDRHARIDAKTGLPNARHWDDRSRDLISAARLHDTPVAVAILDIDHFKSVNDTYGHLVGDDVLEEFAAILRSQVNPGDVIGRFGGEEFVVTLFGLTADRAGEVADRIRRAIATRVFDARPRQEVGQGGHDGDDETRKDHAFTITCTVGLATSDAFGFDLTALLAAADEALGAGKASGRNTVHRAERRDDGATGTGSRHRAGFGGEVPAAFRVASKKRSWTHVANQQQSTQRRRAGRK
jgi:diguanylate cyclase (GGDEF)-like protein